MLAHLDLDDAVVELAGPELPAQPLAHAVDTLQLAAVLGRGALVRDRAQRREQEVEQALLGVLLRLVLDLVDLLEPDHVDGDFDQVAHHRLHVAADVSDFGELGRFDLEKGRAGQASQPARQLGFADAGRPDHDDVLGRDLLGHLGIEFLAADPVAQRDRDGLLGLVLAHHVLVQRGHDLPGGHLVQSPRRCWPLAHKLGHA